MMAGTSIAKSKGMRIAYVTETYPPEINGVALTVARTVRHLRDRGHSLELIRPRQQAETCGAAAGEWRTHGMAIPMYPEMRFGWALPSAIQQHLSQSRPQLVHVATPGPLGWAAVAAASRMGVACTSDFRTNFHQYSRY
jgi:hypothetical protein